uniref:Caerulein-4.1/4.1Y4 n=1 Tax=Ranoidea citropa TaxID=94770 RepID=CAE41_RANCI|nr:RecName: Full=Caerulein-4.1/4.1Y4 [Ranoidea citropa]
QQDYTGSHMDF